MTDSNETLHVPHRNRRRLLLASPWVAASAVFAPRVRAAEQPLTFGVFPRLNNLLQRFMPMAAYLSERIGRKVEVVTEKNFETFWTAVRGRRYDVVHYNQFHYIRSAQDYHVIAHIEESNKRMITGVMFVRQESGITELSQLRGRTVIFGGGEDAMMSYIANRYQLLQAGVQKGDFKALFATNPANALLALARGAADAAGAGDGVPALQAVKDAMGSGELKAIAASPPLLQLPVAVRREMPAAVRLSIQSALLDLKNSDAGRQVLESALMTGMGKAEDRDYDPHRRMVNAVLQADKPARTPPRKG